MDKQKAIEVASAYFPNYPKVKTFHVTHDEQVFEVENDAQNHARTLGKDKDAIHAVSKDEVKKAEKPSIDKELEKLNKAVTSAEGDVAKKQDAFDKADAKTKTKKEAELNAAKEKLEAAKAAVAAKQKGE